MRAAASKIKVPKFDPIKYGKMLQIVRPHNINNAVDYQKVSEQIGNLIDTGSKRTAEESVLLKLLVTLIEEYERKHNHAVKEASPLEVLQYLMEEHNHTAKNLWTVVGDKSLVSRILHGQRSMSKQVAAKLAEFYHIAPAVFIFNSPL